MSGAWTKVTVPLKEPLIGIRFYWGPGRVLVTTVATLVLEDAPGVLAAILVSGTSTIFNKT
jgi:hypothetical protein